MKKRVLFDLGWWNKHVIILSKIREVILMSALWLGLAAILIPIGVVILVEWPDNENLATGFFITGLVCVGIGFLVGMNEYKNSKIEAKNRSKEQKIRDIKDKFIIRQYVKNIALLNIIARQLGARRFFTKHQIENEIKEMEELYKKEIDAVDEDEELW